jgi:hypothetical protein
MLAEHILDGKAADFDPSAFVDRYEVALVELLKKKQTGIQPKRVSTEPTERRVVNLNPHVRRKARRRPCGSRCGCNGRIFGIFNSRETKMAKNIPAAPSGPCSSFGPALAGWISATEAFTSTRAFRTRTGRRSRCILI